VILAVHSIISAYGFWLPNDPRGSWSDFVRNWELRRFGPATKVETRQSVAGRPHDAALRAAAKRELRYPPVVFNGLQARSIGMGFARCVERTGCVIYACAILPEHTHLVIARHRYRIQQLVNLPKGDATRQLAEDNLHPFANYPEPRPSPWAVKAWHVYVDSPAHLASAVRYVLNNPLKERKSRQRWSFVTSIPGL
jgi:REP element-mobilizing transposase RayT